MAQNRQERLQPFVLAHQHHDPTFQRSDPLERIIHPIRVGWIAVVSGIIHVNKVSASVLVVNRSRSSNIKVTPTSVKR